MSAPVKSPDRGAALADAGRAAPARADRRQRRPHPPRAPRPARAGGALPARPGPLPSSPFPATTTFPYTFPARFTRPWAEFERLWETTRARCTSRTALCLVGLNSVRPWRHQSGAVRDEPARLGGVAARSRTARRPARRRAAPPAGRRALADAQAAGRPARPRARGHWSTRARSCPVSGHIHQGAVAERHEFEVWSENQRGAAVATAPGLGQPRPHRRGEARGLLVYEADERSLTVHTYIWRDGEWRLTAERRFPRGPAALD